MKRKKGKNISPSFRFIVMGDSQSSVFGVKERVFRLIMSNLKTLTIQPSLMFFLGDMVYGGKKLEEQLNGWKNIVEDYYNSDICYPILGNHEHDEEIFSNVFDHLPNEQLLGYKRTVYYIDYENCRFIILNSIRESYRGFVINSYQRNWLEKILKESKKTHNFVMFHVPAFPSGSHYKESLDADEEERNALWNIIDKYKATAVFIGHEHNYCRRIINKAFNNNEYNYKNSIYQITLGSAGAAVSPRLFDSRNIIVGPIGTHHYMVVDVNNDIVTFKVYDQNNRVIDSFIIDANNTIKLLERDILIPINSEWRYLDDGSNQGTIWSKIYFNDATWGSGSAKLGYGQNYTKTVVNYGDDPEHKFITTYFRKNFQVKNPVQYSKVILKILRDDGAVVYLNGKEVFRTNMPEGKINYKTLASKALSYPEESIYQKTVIDNRYLVEGSNVIAVEIHQANSHSSDIGFNLELIGIKNNNEESII